MFHFHGTDTTALSGAETLISVANMVASAMRGRSDRRNKLLTDQMQQLIFRDGDNIVVSYLQFCDLLGQRSTRNNVLLRQVSPSSVLGSVRNKIHGLRHIGLDVFAMSQARLGQGDVGLVITKKFKDDADLIPAFFKERTEEIDMADILAEGKRINERRRSA